MISESKEAPYGDSGQTSSPAFSIGYGEDQAQKIFKAEAETEAIECALDCAIDEQKNNRRVAEANERFVAGGNHHSGCRGMLIFVPDNRIHFFKVQRVIRTGGNSGGTLIDASLKLRMLD